MKLISNLNNMEIGEWICVTHSGWQKIIGIDINRVTGNIINIYYSNGKCDVTGRQNKSDKYPTCFNLCQMPDEYIQLFGLPPHEIKKHDIVWVWNDDIKEKNLAVFKKYYYPWFVVYGINGHSICFNHCVKY